MTQRDPTPAELIAFVKEELSEARLSELPYCIRMFSALLTVLEGRRQDEPALASPPAKEPK